MKKFKLTLPNILMLLEKDDQESKEILKERFQNISDNDLFELNYSVRCELNLRRAKDNECTTHLLSAQGV